MAEIEITLPTVQYGNVKIKATPEEWGLDGVADAADVGVWSAIYLNLFQQGFRKGAAMDVDAHLGASQKAAPGDPQTASERLAAKQYADGRANAESVIGSDAPGDVQAAAYELLDEGLGGVTEVDARGPEGPGEEPTGAPWDSPALDTKPKPWETGGQKPTKVAEIDW